MVLEIKKRPLTDNNRLRNYVIVSGIVLGAILIILIVGAIRQVHTRNASYTWQKLDASKAIQLQEVDEHVIATRTDLHALATKTTEALSSIDYVSALLSYLLSIAAIVAGGAVTYHVSSHFTEKSTNDLQQSINEYGRKPIENFPAVFERAWKIIDNLYTIYDHNALRVNGQLKKSNDDFLWVLNYTPYLGKVHTFNKANVGLVYKWTHFAQDPTANVGRLATRQIELAHSLPNFKLVTMKTSMLKSAFTDNHLDTFDANLTLPPNFEYKDGVLDPKVSTKEFTDRFNQDNKGAVRQIVENGHEACLFRIRAEIDSDGKVVEAWKDIFKTQMYIAKYGGEYHCLVFSTMGGKVRGFYTKTESIALFYVDRFLELSEEAKATSTASKG